MVLAYLIHANAWSLKTSYAYVAERRSGISPNIGFVAELMQFEEAELGLKKSGGVVQGGGPSGGADSRNIQPDGTSDIPGMTRRARDAAEPYQARGRESLPPAWGASLDSRPRRSAVPLGGAVMTDDGTGGEGDNNREAGNNADDRTKLSDEREVRKNGQWVQQRR